MGFTVVPYSEDWQAAFEREAALLREALGRWLVGGVHHIGSTAVPGLPAKPILDMLAGVRDLDAAREAIPMLGELGYAHAEHRPHEAVWSYKQAGADYRLRTHQLHLTTVNSDLWRERLAFRDALRADSRLRDQYQALKECLAQGTTDNADYTKGKREFVVKVLREAGVDLV